MTRESWRKFGSSVLAAIVGVLVVFAVFTVLLRGQAVERRQTTRNVERLVLEAEKNRQVLCLAVVHNPANAASDDPEVLRLCAEVGVEP